MHQQIYDKLKAIARTGDIITYSEIAPLANLDMSKQEDRNRIAQILGEISTYEHKNGRPMLSSVVIHKENNIPGPGFFTLAKELGIYNQKNDVLFFINELQRVHDYWKHHQS